VRFEIKTELDVGVLSEFVFFIIGLAPRKSICIGCDFFIRWRLRHLREIGVRELEAFLSMLAGERNVSASAHN
jgi:hypothetical protein